MNEERIGQDEDRSFAKFRVGRAMTASWGSQALCLSSADFKSATHSTPDSLTISLQGVEIQIERY